MKSLVMSFLLSFSVLAGFESAEVNQSFAYPQYSWTSCQAFTDCYDFYGRYIGRVSCTTYGSQWHGIFGVSTNQCNWFVQPGVSVTCNGFQQSVDAFGRIFWQYRNLHFRCPGR
jgi:hypothetical protein